MNQITLSGRIGKVQEGEAQEGKIKIKFSLCESESNRGDRNDPLWFWIHWYPPKGFKLQVGQYAIIQGRAIPWSRKENGTWNNGFLVSAYKVEVSSPQKSSSSEESFESSEPSEDEIVF